MLFSEYIKEVTLKPYHFHLIRNILKLTYCFPIRNPSAPKSDNQAEGCQGPSVLGRVHAVGTKKDLLIPPRSLVEFVGWLLAASTGLSPRQGFRWALLPPRQKEGPRDTCRAA